MVINSSVQSVYTSRQNVVGSYANSVIPGTTSEATPSTTGIESGSGSTSLNKTHIVQQVVTEQVSLALEFHSAALPGAYAADYERQSEHLVNKVLQKIDEGKSGDGSRELSATERHHKAINDVRFKVEHGFSQATTMLTAIGLYDDSAAGQVDDVRSQVNQAIEQAATIPVDDVVNGVVANKVQAATVNSASVQRDITTSLQLTTRDGDVVTIDFSRNASLSTGVYADDQGILGFADKSLSSQFDISVDGDLDRRESKSIRRLLNRVDQVAQRLLSGDVAAAMEKLGDLKINSRQLSDMVLTMSSSFSYQAVSAYSEVSTLDADLTELPVSSAKTVETAGSPTDNTVAAISSEAGAGQSTDESAGDESAGDEYRPDHDHDHDHGRRHTRGVLDLANAVRDAVEIVTDVARADYFQDANMSLRKIFESVVDNLMASDHEPVSHVPGDIVKQLFAGIVDAVDQPVSDFENVAGDVSGSNIDAPV